MLLELGHKRDTAQACLKRIGGLCEPRRTLWQSLPDLLPSGSFHVSNLLLTHYGFINTAAPSSLYYGQLHLRPFSTHQIEWVEILQILVSSS